MRIREIIEALELIAPPALQESYDNSGLLVGNADADVRGVLVCLDSTPEVIAEAREKGCNLVIAHHPIIFRGLRSLTGSNYVERAVIEAVRADIAIYAIHTNLDNVLRRGVNAKIAARLDLRNTEVLRPIESAPGDIAAGSGLVGYLQGPLSEGEFLSILKRAFKTPVVRHTALLGKDVYKVAVCGGAGKFLLEDAVQAGCQAFVTADVKYHEFFDADGRLILADVGHYESEQFTVELIIDILRDKFATFAPNSTETITNPVIYYT